MNLRKVIFICILLFAFKSVSAQTSKLQFGVKGGLNLSTAFFNDAEAVKFKQGYHFGGTVGYLITPKFELQSGLFFSNIGSKLEGYSICGSHFCYGENLTTIEEQYLKLPLYAAFRKNISDNLTFKIGLGPYLGYGIGGKTTNITGINKREWDTFGNDLESLNQFDFGAGCIADIEYSKFILGFGFESSIINLMYKKEYLNPFDYRNVNISISLGYKF